MKVRVRTDLPDTFIGFHEHARRRPGDVFSIDETKRRKLFKDEHEKIKGDLPDERMVASFAKISDSAGTVPQAFSFRWMEPVESAVREKVTTAQQSLDRKAAKIREEKAAQRDAEGSADGDGGAAPDGKDVI